MPNSGDGARVLIVDDEEKNRKIMGVVLESHGYDFETAAGGAEALDKVKIFRPDLIYLDIMMPEMDGYAVCRALKADAQTSGIPVIMITALTDRESRLQGLAAGADDFLAKPVDKNELVLRTRNLLKSKKYNDLLLHCNEQLEAEVLARTAELRESRELLKGSYHDTVLRLTMAAEFRDEETAAHIRRVGIYCARLATALGCSPDEVEIISYAAPMHDIGKIGIPAEILLKGAKLNSEEFALMRTHTLIGGKILKDSSSSYIRMGEQIAMTHHERWNGTGYPRGLRGEEIPRAGRIMNIADQYDALRSIRPYKPALDHETARDILLKGDGRTMPEHFDPLVLEAFADLHREFAEIFNSTS